MQKYKIIVAYDGTNYHGWQQQPRDITIAGTLETHFKHVFKENINIFGASRTDAGVHALGQTAQFSTDLIIAPTRMQEAWNKSLPTDIKIRELTPVPDAFNPCRNVKQKVYYYHLFLKQPLPFIARYGWHYDFIDRVDLNKFIRGLQFYKGEHDFASFCTMDDDRSTVRRIDEIIVKKYTRFNMIQIIIKGESFLHFQIRRMIGYAIDIARRKELPIDYLKAILEEKNPQQTLLKAEGSGLCLRKIWYHHE